jgi:hypothetical protein
MHYKRVEKGTLLFRLDPNPSPAFMKVFGFCWKRVVLDAQLMTKTTNKSRTYFQRATVQINFKQIYFLKSYFFPFDLLYC